MLVLNKIIHIEFRKLKFKFIFYNCLLPLCVRQMAWEKFVLLSCKPSMTEIRSRCCISNRSRGVFKFVKVSRFQMKLLSHKNWLIGFRKYNI